MSLARPALDWGLRARWWVIPLAFLVVGACWAIASPTGSSPDDDYHLSSTWCTRDGTPGVCEADPKDAGVRLVPRAVVAAAECYRFEQGPSAACVADVRTDVTAVPTDRVNQVQGLYPVGFYAAMGTLVGPDVDRSVLAMRLVNVLVASLVLLAIMVLAPPTVSAAATLAAAAGFVPLGLFIVASTNPSAWAVTGILGVWALALAWLRDPGTSRYRTALTGLALVASAALAMASRVDANAYLLLTVLVVLTIHGWRRSLQQPARVLLLAGLVAAAVVVYVATSSVAVAGVGLGGGEPLGSADAGVGLLVTNLVHLPVLIQGIVGGWALGWNDTPMPPLVFVTGVLVLGMLAMRGLQAASRRIIVATVLALAGLVGVPIVFLQVQRLGVGELVQPRYILPLLVLAVATVSLGADDGRPPPMRPLVAWLVAGLLAASAVVAFWTNAHRYLVGTDQPLFALDLDVQWSPMISIVPLVLVTAVSTTVLMVAVLSLSMTKEASQ